MRVAQGKSGPCAEVRSWHGVSWRWPAPAAPPVSQYGDAEDSTDSHGRIVEVVRARSSRRGPRCTRPDSARLCARGRQSKEARGGAERARELASVEEVDVVVPAAAEEPGAGRLGGARGVGWSWPVHPGVEPRRGGARVDERPRPTRGASSGVMTGTEPRYGRRAASRGRADGSARPRRSRAGGERAC